MKYIERDFCLCVNKTCKKQDQCLRHRARSVEMYQNMSNFDKCEEHNYEQFIDINKHPFYLLEELSK